MTSPAPLVKKGVAWKKPPTLCPASECESFLDFAPVAHWPQGLPAVAVGGIILAGFQQELAFNHELSLEEKEEIEKLFCSLYSELSFAELARLWKLSESHVWFPMAEVALHYRVGLNPHFFEVAEVLLQTPPAFQIWCSRRKLHQGDLLPLLATHHFDDHSNAKEGLRLALSFIARMEMTRNQGAQALEWLMDLLLDNPTWVELQPDSESAEAWHEKLRRLRFPETEKKDKQSSRQAMRLPWPGSSQVKWTRQGDQSGIEVKLFVSDPTDLQKCVQSFQNVLKELEKKDSNPWTVH